MEIVGKPKTLLQIEADLKKLAECYDLISYGFYFHDLIDPRLANSSKSSLRNMLILIGDYFLVKSNYDVAQLKQIELYKIWAHTTQKYSEGEAMRLTDKKVDVSQLKTRDLDADTYLEDENAGRVDNGKGQRSLERFKDSDNVKILIEYCYLTGGYLFACSLQSAFKLANFSPKTQRLAFEFGKNFGIAIKMSNQLSALCLSNSQKFDLSTEESTERALNERHLNLSYWSKFQSVPADIMQELVSEYVARSRKLLLTFCDSYGEDSQPVSGMLSSESGKDSPVDSTDSSRRIEAVKNSEQALLLLQTLKSILNEIQDFNHDNVQQFRDQK